MVAVAAIKKPFLLNEGIQKLSYNVLIHFLNSLVGANGTILGNIAFNVNLFKRSMALPTIGNLVILLILSPII